MKFSIPMKPCGCGVLINEECDCLAFAAEAERLFQVTSLVVPTGTRDASPAAEQPALEAAPQWAPPGALILYGPASIVRQEDAA